MKLFVFIIISFSCFAAAYAQNTNEETDKPKAGSFRKPLEDAQKSKEPAKNQINLINDDGCGNPLAEGDVYSFRNGKAIVVTDDNKIIVKINRTGSVKGKKYENPDEVKRMQQPQLLTVALVGLDDGVNQSEIRKFLLDNVLERDVTVIGNTRNDGDKSLDALVKITSGETRGEVSQLLLEKGIAKYKEFQLTNLVPTRTACELRRAEEKAKAEKLGIWAQ
jgi:hypothetical protein